MKMDILASDSNMQHTNIYEKSIQLNNFFIKNNENVAESLLLLGLDMNSINYSNVSDLNWISNNNENISTLNPIIDIKVIKSDDEISKNYYKLNKSYMGSEIFAKTLFFGKKINSIVCFCTGNNKLPIIDIKYYWYEFYLFRLIRYNQSAPPGYTIITTTDNGEDASLNGSSNIINSKNYGDGPLYLVYKRAIYPPKYAIVDLCIIRRDIVEEFPHTYYIVEPKITTGLVF